MMTDLEQIAKEATDHGMTYGEYVPGSESHN